MAAFESFGILPEVQQALSELGFIAPMPVQEAVIPLLLSSNTDLIALAQTGTGKTAAFGVPIIQQTNKNAKHTEAVVLAPTRELCVQIGNDLTDYAKYVHGMRILSVYGGASIEAQIKLLRKPVQIVVATPGRLVDLIKRGVVRLNNVRTVVLDEADEMLSMGFEESLNFILSAMPEARQTLLFSATMSKEVERIANGYMHNPQRITIGVRNAGAENVKHICFTVQAKDKYNALKRIVDYNPNIYGIVFCRTRQDTQEVADKLMRDGYNADALHGDLSQAQRDLVMQKFRIRHLQLLVATDVAARGLDVDDVSHVINYSLPDDLEVYTHRSGRTGRAGKKGVSIVIVNLREKGIVKRIEKLIGKEFEHRPVYTGMEICQKQLFRFVDSVERVETESVEMEAFLPQIYKKLEWLDKEELIKRFVSLEFDRMLNYYKNTEDIEEPVKEEKEEKRKRNKNKADFCRLCINRGKADGLRPKDLLKLINITMPDNSVELGRIDLQKTYAVFEVENRYASEVMKKLNGLASDGVKLSVSRMPDEKTIRVNKKAVQQPQRKKGKVGDKGSKRKPNRPRNIK